MGICHCRRAYFHYMQCILICKRLCPYKRAIIVRKVICASSLMSLAPTFVKAIDTHSNAYNDIQQPASCNYPFYYLTNPP
jgi:hypothetical protein